MAKNEEKKTSLIAYMLAIPGIIAAFLMFWKWYSTKKMMNSLDGMSFKNESKLRKQRNIYKDTLESAILKAASKIKEKKDISEKNEDITAYKEEIKAKIDENDQVVSYKEEN